MSKITYFSRRAWIGAVIAGIFVSADCYIVMPIVPRQVIALEAPVWSLAFSSDFGYAAVKSGGSNVVGRPDEVLHVWNVSDGHLLFSKPIRDEFFPYPARGIEIAFDEEKDCVVVFGGKVIGCHIRQFELPLGTESVSSSKQLKFRFEPTDADQFGLFSDEKGRLYVTVEKENEDMVSIYELSTGTEIATWVAPKFFRHNDLGGIIGTDGKHGLHFRELPSGKVVQRKQKLSDAFGHCIGTPDGRTLLRVGPTGTQICTESALRNVDLVAPHIDGIALSPDGKLFAVRVNQLHAYPDWLSTALGWLSVTRPEAVFVVYDLDTATTIATFPDARSAHFSRDGRSFALVTERGIEFFDLPLRKPWWRITSVGLAAGVGVLGIASLRKWRAGRKRKPAASLK